MFLPTTCFTTVKWQKKLTLMASFPFISSVEDTRMNLVKAVREHSKLTVKCCHFHSHVCNQLKGYYNQVFNSKALPFL